MLMFLINSIMLSCSVWVFIDKATCGYFFGPFLALFVVSRTISLGAVGGSVVQSSEQGSFTSEFVDSILATDSCEKSQSTLCRKSWVVSRCSGFLPQGKLSGWVRINISYIH
jgi:hypothetical protein